MSPSFPPIGERVILVMYWKLKGAVYDELFRYGVCRSTLARQFAILLFSHSLPVAIQPLADGAAAATVQALETESRSFIASGSAS